MINIKGRKDYIVALESVAMTDIVLNMFIFFFISFSLLYTFSPIRISKVEVNLPKAKSAVSIEGSDKITLAIQRGGAYFVNDEEIKQKDLKRILKLRFKENAGAALLLKVDRMARFDNVVKALDVINELDIQRVSVAAVKGGGK